MRALVEHALRSRGAEVVAVSDGAQAVEAAADGFDLILLDIRMPVKDGLAAAREIRRAGCLTPMIALTASDTVCDRSSILGAGFDDLWGKPITLIDLVERVAAYLPSRLERLRSRHSPSASTDKVDLWESRIAAARRAYAADLPTRIEELAEAAAKQDNDTVREILHQLIGSSGIHGFDEFSGESVRLYALCQQAGYSVRPDEMELLKRLAAAASAGMKATPVEE
jgi:CheY-like chemotaxis protein